MKKKIFALLMAMVLVLGMSTTALANTDSPYWDNTKPETKKINVLCHSSKDVEGEEAALEGTQIYIQLADAQVSGEYVTIASSTYTGVNECEVSYKGDVFVNGDKEYQYLRIVYNAPEGYYGTYVHNSFTVTDLAVISNGQDEVTIKFPVQKEAVYTYVDRDESEEFDVVAVYADGEYDRTEMYVGSDDLEEAFDCLTDEDENIIVMLYQSMTDGVTISAEAMKQMKDKKVTLDAWDMHTGDQFWWEPVDSEDEFTIGFVENASISSILKAENISHYVMEVRGLNGSDNLAAFYYQETDVLTTGTEYSEVRGAYIAEKLVYYYDEESKVFVSSPADMLYIVYEDNGELAEIAELYFYGDAFPHSGYYVIVDKALPAKFTEVEKAPAPSIEEVEKELDEALKSEDATVAKDVLVNTSNETIVEIMKEDITKVEKADAAWAEEKDIKVETKSEVKEVEASKITIVGAALNANGVDEKDVVLSVKEPEKKVEVEKKYENAVALNIELLVAGEAKEDLAVPVAITMPIPTGVAKENLVVLHYHGDATTPAVIVPTVNADGTMTFIVDGFSTFVVANQVVEAAPEAPKTGDTSGTALVCSLLFLAAGVVLVMKRNSFAK